MDTTATNKYDNDLYGHVICIEMVISALGQHCDQVLFSRDDLRSQLASLVEDISPEGLSDDAVEELKDGARNALRRMLGLPQKAEV